MGGTNAWLSGTDVLDGILIGGVSGLVGGQLGQWAGRLGGVVINGIKTTSPVLQGIVTGAIGGGAGGGLTGFTMALGSGASLGDALDAGWSSAKSGFVIGGIAGGASASAKAMSNKINPFTGEKIEMHHSDPMFMGGEKNQNLTPLSKSTHAELHRDLNDFLKMQTDDFGNHMRPQSNNPGFKIRETFIRPIRIEAMQNFYDLNRFTYPRLRYDFYKNNSIRWRF